MRVALDATAVEAAVCVAPDVGDAVDVAAVDVAAVWSLDCVASIECAGVAFGDDEAPQADRPSVSAQTEAIQAKQRLLVTPTR